MNISPPITIIRTRSSCETAKMLVVLPDEERRLITFTLPTESCTVTELLDQVGIQLTPNMQVRCVAIADEDLDYVVTITEMKAPQVIVQTMTPIQVQVQQTPQSQLQPPPPLTPVMPGLCGDDSVVPQSTLNSFPLQRKLQ